MASTLQLIQLLSGLRKYLVIGQLSFSLFFIGIRIVTLPERIEMDLITESDQTMRAVHSCNNWFGFLVFTSDDRCEQAFYRRNNCSILNLKEENECFVWPLCINPDPAL